MQLLIRLVPAGMLDGMPFLQGLGLSFRLVAFACAISLIGKALFGLAPLLRIPLPEMPP